MIYTVIVRSRGGDPLWITESLLDGLVPQNVIASTACERVDAAGICAACDVLGARCHVLRLVARDEYAKHCPVLWWDLFRPASWKVGDLA